MANTRFAIKKHKQSEKRRVRNKAVKSAVKTLIKKAKSFITAGEKEKAARVYQALLHHLPQNHPLYRPTVSNLLYLQQPPSQQQQQQQQTPSPSDSQEKPQDNQSKPEQKESQEPPSQQDSQALLNLVQQEERKNLQKIPLSGGRRSRYPW